MALEAIVFPHDPDLFIQTNWWDSNPTAITIGEEQLQWFTQGDQLDPTFCELGSSEGAGNGDRPSCPSLLVDNFEQWDGNSSSSPEHHCTNNNGDLALAVVGGRRKRRRVKVTKNKEEVENQRMTHIAVERNRRKQMNQYLSALRSLMPPSYVQRGDQASIIGGAINFVRELEQLLQSLEAQKKMKELAEASMQGDITCLGGGGGGVDARFGVSSPFANVFTFPQYSTVKSSSSSSSSSSNIFSQGEVVSENRSAIADIEVTMVESHANLKVLSRRRPRQLIKMIVGLQKLKLTILHLNVTTIEQMVLYSLSLKVEEDSLLTSMDEIAAAVYRILVEIQEAMN